MKYIIFGLLLLLFAFTQAQPWPFVQFGKGPVQGAFFNAKTPTGGISGGTVNVNTGSFVPTKGGFAASSNQATNTFTTQTSQVAGGIKNVW